MRRRWPACRMLSASLVSSSLVHVGSKLSSQLISSSNMAAGLICSCSISEATENKSANLRGNLQQSIASASAKKIHRTNHSYYKVNRYEPIPEKKSRITVSQERVYSNWDIFVFRYWSASWWVKQWGYMTNLPVKSTITFSLFYFHKIKKKCFKKKLDCGLALLLVRSSRSWHRRSKYSVHCESNL